MKAISTITEAITTTLMIVLLIMMIMNCVKQLQLDRQKEKILIQQQQILQEIKR